jgi:hypothetical protein
MPYGIYENNVVIARFVAPLTLRSNQPVFASDTLSLSRQVGRRSAQRWELETKLEPLTTGAQDLFVNFVTKGYADAVTIITPQNYGAARARTAVSAAVLATGTAGASVVALTGLTGLIPKGTMIKFASHHKVYMTTADRSGSGNLSIFPTLRQSMTAIAMTYKDDVQMRCMWDLDTITGMVYEDGIMMDNGTVKLVEKL